jgi:predicted secreted hydrolase
MKNNITPIKIILYIFILHLLFAVCVLAQDWKTYPYHEEGSLIYFPDDEGRHTSVITEGWYANAHVTGTTSGIDYTLILNYWVDAAQPSRFLGILDDTNEEYYPEFLPANFTFISEDHLFINVTPQGGVAEEWITLEDSLGDLIPFQYHITANSQFGSIDLFYNTIKKPLVIGGQGFVNQGLSSAFYYYSQTMLNITGTITLNEFSETINGTGWIDKTFGDYHEPNYEWFGIQLSNGMDLNFYNIFNDQEQIPETSNYRFCSMYIDDNTTNHTSEFELSRLKYVIMPDNLACYSQQWRLTMQNIDLVITTRHSNAEIFIPVRGYDGSASVTGTVNGFPVTGIGEANLKHSYSHPEINLLNPNGGEIWDGSQSVTWELLNPDDGRPVYYDLEYSIDGGSSFIPIAEDLTGTSYDWDVSGIYDGTECLLHVIGNSIDGTLEGNDISDASFQISSDLPLPVVLLTFSGFAGSNFVTLKWKTTSEVNNYGFAVLRKENDDENFYEIDSYKTKQSLNGAGTSSNENSYIYIDNSVLPNTTYWYKLISINFNGVQEEYNTISVKTTGDFYYLGPIEDGIQNKFNLSQNFPNPFNPSTRIVFNIPYINEGKYWISINIYDVSGKKVRSLAEGTLGEGSYQVEWNGLNDRGISMPSGVYFCNFSSDNFSETIRMILMR